LQHALAINPPGNKLESMVENDDTPTVTIEVEMADSSEEPEGSFESVIKVRITGSERHACELVKESRFARHSDGIGRRRISGRTY
jgi:hypothetical protein